MNQLKSVLIPIGYAIAFAAAPFIVFCLALYTKDVVSWLLDIWLFFGVAGLMSMLVFGGTLIYHTTSDNTPFIQKTLAIIGVGIIVTAFATLLLIKDENDDRKTAEKKAKNEAYAQCLRDAANGKYSDSLCIK